MKVHVVLYLSYDKFVMEFLVAVEGVSVPITIASIEICYRDWALTTLGYTASVALCKVTKTRSSLIHV